MATLTAYLANRAAIATAIEADDSAPVFVRLGSGGYLRLRDDVPATRGDCPTQRPCPHTKCEQHLYTVSGVERAGRRVAGKTPLSTLRTVYRLQNPPPSCTLDVADAVQATGEPLAIKLVGEYLGIRASQVHAYEARALAKLKKLGVTLRSLMEGDE